MVARNGALNAEKAMEALEAEENKEKELTVLIEMRDRFNVLEDKILKGEEPLTVVDFIQLYVRGRGHVRGGGAYALGPPRPSPARAPLCWRAGARSYG